MAAKPRIPRFRSQKEEAEWWDAHPEVITELFIKARKEGKIKRLPAVRAATKSVTIRIPVSDLATAQELAEKRPAVSDLYQRPPRSGAGTRA